MKRIGNFHFYLRSWFRLLPHRLGQVRIRAQRRRFLSLQRIIENRVDCTVDRSLADAIIVFPRKTKVHSATHKSIQLTYLAMVHGDEIAGAAILNQLLAKFAFGIRPIEVPVAFVWGNPDAALRNVRGIHCDLNRQFGFATGDLPEQKRAHELGRILGDTAYLLDFHQTAAETDRSFFIFPYEKNSVAFAQAIAPGRTIVTHHDFANAESGLPSDGFVQRRGGAGVTLELGKKGMARRQIRDGVACGLAAYEFVRTGVSGSPSVGPHLTWTDSVPWPSEGLVSVVSGLKNFTRVAKGTKLAEVDGCPIVAPRDGLVLFPRRLTAKQQRRYRPADLCRILGPRNAEN